MNIHEHQAKELFNGYDIPVSTGSVAYEKSQINEAVGKVKGPIWVVKAQIHAGGRGKGGGVKVVSSKEEAVNEAEKMFGMNLITCLLYTSPSPRDLSTSRMPSSA